MFNSFFFDQLFLYTAQFNTYFIFYFFFFWIKPLLIYYFVGFWILFLGFVNILRLRKNILLVLLYIEVILLSLNFLFIISSLYLDDRIGYTFSYYLLTLAAIETVIGLAILIAFYRLRRSINIDFITYLKS